MTRRIWLIGIVGTLALAAVVAYGLYLTRPMPLRIAVGPPGSEDARLISAIAAHLGRDRAAIRLRVIPKDGPDDAAAAIDSGEASIAVVRRDVAMPAKGQAIAILRRNIVVLLVPPDSKIEKVSDLSGRKVGFIRRTINGRLLTTLLTNYEVKPHDINGVAVDPGEVGEVVRTGKIDALLLTGAISNPILADMVTAMSRDGQPPKFIQISESEAIAQRLPAYESTQILAGAFGGTPPRPADSVETIGFSHYIVVHSNIDEQTAGELARLLFGIRSSLAGEFPAIARIEAPSTDKDAAVSVHPGAAAYLDGTQKNFFDRYSDYFYLMVMLVSILGSGAAGLMTYSNSANRQNNKLLLNRLLEIAKSAHGAETELELNALRDEADEILASTISQAADDRVSQAGLSAFTLALDQARQAITARRAFLHARAPAQVEPLAQRRLRPTSRSL
jgi:TRAP transporter TAXI family solute receptor